MMLTNCFPVFVVFDLVYAYLLSFSKDRKVVGLELVPHLVH